MCKAEKKSAVKRVTILSASQELQTSAQKHQKIDAKKSVVNSSLLIDTVNSTCESMKISTVNSSFSVLFAIRSEQIFEFSTLFEFIISFKSLSLKSSTFKSVCESEKKSTIANLSSSQKSSISFATSRNLVTDTRTSLQFVSFKCSNLSIATLKISSERAKSASLQRVACVRICKRCRQSFNFNNKFHEHLREHHVQKFVTSENSDLRILALESTYKIIEKSTVFCSSASLISQFASSILFATKLSTTCSHCKQFTSKQRVEWRFRIACLSARLKTSRLNLSLNTFVIISEAMKNASIQWIARVRTNCKQCKQNFDFHKKLFEHIHEHKVSKSVKSFDFRISTFEFAYKIAEKSTIICSLTSQFAQSIFFATSRNQIFESETFFKTITSSKRSNLTIATLKITSQSMKKLSFNCSLIFSFSSFRISIRKHHEFHMQKSYLTMNNLSRMFTEKSKSFDLRSHQDRSYFSQSFDIRQSSQSCFSTASKKSYLTIENLFEMFDEKFRKKNMFQNQKNVSFREFFSKQSRITFYFEFVINRKSSINQNLKSSKSKSLKQHMFAKFIRIAFNKYSFEKSIDLSYKLFDVFCINSKSFVEISFFIFVLLRFLSIFLLVLAFVSIISAARLNCINVYEQVISIIDRVIQ